MLPVGLEFVVKHDPSPPATGVAAKPEPYDEWEGKLVEQADREHPRYGGYYLVVSFERLGSHCELLERGDGEGAP